MDRWDCRMDRWSTENAGRVGDCRGKDSGHRNCRMDRLETLLHSRYILDI